MCSLIEESSYLPPSFHVNEPQNEGWEAGLKKTLQLAVLRAMDGEEDLGHLIGS